MISLNIPFFTTIRNKNLIGKFDHTAQLLKDMYAEFPYIDDLGAETLYIPVEVRAAERVENEDWWNSIFPNKPKEENPYYNEDFNPSEHFRKQVRNRIDGIEINTRKRYIDLSANYTSIQAFKLFRTILREYNKVKKDNGKSYDLAVGDSYATLMDGGLYIDNYIIPYTITYDSFTKLSDGLMKKIRAIIGFVEYKMKK